MTEIEFNKRAEEKYDSLDNGIRKSINEFLDALLHEKITEKDLDIAFKAEGSNFYSKNCGKMYVLLVKVIKQNLWYILDILTPEEYKELINS